MYVGDSFFLFLLEGMLTIDVEINVCPLGLTNYFRDLSSQIGRALISLQIHQMPTIHTLSSKESEPAFT